MLYLQNVVYVQIQHVCFEYTFKWVNRNIAFICMCNTNRQDEQGTWGSKIEIRAGFNNEV